MKRPFPVWLLVFVLAFLALGGFNGGIAMLTDPSGKSLQMDEVLPLLHVPNYFLPGLFLFFVMGLAPCVLIYGLLARPNWKWAESIFCWSGHYWAWTGSLTLGIVLMIWLGMQGILIGFRWPIQYVTAANGLIIILFALIPGVRKFYKIHH